LKNEKGKMKNVNSKGKEISFMNFAIYTLPFALKFALFQRAKLLPYCGFGISVGGLEPPHGESQVEDLTS
jgi:hypothetical protein